MAADRLFSLLTDRLRWGVVFFGLCLLAVPGMSLVGLAVLGAIRGAESIFLGGIFLLLALFALRGITFELRRVQSAVDIESIEPTEMIGIAGAIMVGGFVTFVLVIEGQLRPVVAASITGILAVLVRSPLAVPAYCGAFVGMTSPVVFPTYWQGLVAGVLAVAVYLLALPVFHGIGGKLGTTAFVGVAITILGTPTSFLSDQLPASSTVGLVVVYSAVAAVVTFTLHHRLPLDPVSTSGVVGILGGVALPWLYPAVGDLLAASIYAASFAGMSDSTRIPDERWMVLVGIVVGLIVVYTAPFLGGSGGKLGTIAFVSCLAIYGLLGTAYRVLVKRRIKRLPRRDVS